LKRLKEQKISIIGAGNVAFHLAHIFSEKGMRPYQILARNTERHEEMKAFASKLITKTAELEPCDILFLAVNDDAVSTLASQIKLKKSLIVHTSGSLPGDAAASSGNKYGVFYPLQTFSKQRFPDFNEIPVFIQAEDQESMIILKNLAIQITSHVHHSDDRMRKLLHLSAVFVSNFSHALYLLAEDFLKTESVPFEYLHPLIKETALKAITSDLSQSQTGPARRNDKETLESHLILLEQHPEKQEIYKLITHYILNKYHPDSYE
jgi:predicted short-subunit dehydrogenase-like oxidoreductase (DUF2520 family)